MTLRVYRGGVELFVRRDGGRDARIQLGHRGHTLNLRAAALAVPYPSGLDRLLNTDPDIEAVLVERASPGLVEELARRQVSYLDLDGYGHVVGPGFVYVAPRSASARGTDPGRTHTPRTGPKTSPFAPRSSRVVRALLGDHLRSWRVSDLAEVAQMNPGNVHRTLGALVEDGLVERDMDFYVVSDPGSLLEAWSELGVRKPLASVTMPVITGLRHEVHKLVHLLGPGAAVSGELAAELYAPYLSSASAIVYCTDRDRWDRAGPFADVPPRLRHTPESIVVNLVDPGVETFGDTVDGLPLVSVAQLYFDLFPDRGRGREAAEHARRVRLGF